MTRLTTQQVLKDKNTKDPNSITSLTLTHKALSDVSCLGEFTNLERLDLSSNNLTSLQGLGSCVNLKWLSVVQNKLESLKGIESLSKLTVLNAGKNKLKSVAEVKSLVSLRALILNDNEIVSLCKLDQLKELNTLVLSRNPIREIGESLVKVKSLSKLSISHCQIQTIDSSLKSCIELKELRIAHNDIKTLPADLDHNKKLQILDLGNNVLTSWSDVKVLKSLVDLKNLNLQGNPIAENDKVAKKVQKFLPHLHILNARPIGKSTKNAIGEVNDFSLNPASELEVQQQERKDQGRKKKSSKHEADQNKSRDFDNAGEVDVANGFEQETETTMVKLSKKEEVATFKRDDNMIEKKLKRKKSQEQESTNEFEKEIDLKEKRKKTEDKGIKDDNTAAAKKPKKSREKLNMLDIIDNKEVSFADFFSADASASPEHDGEKKIVNKAVEGMNSQSGLVAVSGKKKKSKNKGVGNVLQLPSAIEVGMGGPSTWSDE
ncbi:hypothetical protein Tsubulata_018387 [Turnera subulata]|uniref:Protein phosphatase 1 regulatory subunit 7 n=1 Tax=Turnera subulata TaxID=218843 RepID=A0A9Q0JJP3_9ROSI|nr:hypothetical protein Tsubulata_018387 [Turnera subulata]